MSSKPVLSKLRGCEHKSIEIVGIRDDLSAIYECSDCGSEVKPWKSERTYRLDRGGSDE